MSHYQHLTICHLAHCHSPQSFLFACSEHTNHPKKTENPNLSLLQKKVRMLLGTGSGTRTHTVAHWNLNPARLPIPPYPHI